MTPEALTDYLHEHIPLTAALGARVIKCDGSELEVTAPLEPNLNHRCTAFGGSLATLAIVSGWSLLHVALRETELRTRLVIQKSECEFLLPVHGEFRAICRLPEHDWPRFLHTLSRHPRARIRLNSDIFSDGQLALRHTGAFVAEIETTTP